MKKSFNYPLIIILFVFLQLLFIALAYLTHKPIVYGSGVAAVIFILFAFLGLASNVDQVGNRLKQLKHLIKNHAPLLKEDAALQSICNELFTTENSEDVYKKLRDRIVRLETIYHYLYCPAIDKKGVIGFLNNPEKDIISDWYNASVFCVTQELINDQITYSILFLKLNEK